MLVSCSRVCCFASITCECELCRKVWASYTFSTWEHRRVLHPGRDIEDLYAVRVFFWVWLPSQSLGAFLKSPCFMKKDIALEDLDSTSRSEVGVQWATSPALHEVIKALRHSGADLTGGTRKVQLAWFTVVLRTFPVSLGCVLLKYTLK